MSVVFKVFIFLVLLGCGIAPVHGPVDTESNANVIHPPEDFDADHLYIKGSYIVTFKPQLNAVNLLNASFNQESVYFHHQLFSHELAEKGVKDINFISTVELTPKNESNKSVWEHLPIPTSMMGLMDSSHNEVSTGVISRVDFETAEDAKELLSKWEEEGKIWFAEPNWVSQTNAGTFTKLATDYQGDRWHWIKGMRIVEGFKFIADHIAKGNLKEETILAKAPVVAVMDSGVDYAHPAFKDRIWDNESPGESDCPGDEHGCDLTKIKKGTLGQGSSVYPFGVNSSDQACPSDGTPGAAKLASNCLHGTHVAGIVAGRVDAGVPGICPICKIMILKVVSDSDDGGSVTDSSILSGLKYVTRFVKDDANAVRIINASISKFQRSRAVALLVNQLKNHENGTIVIGAAGNEDTSFRAYPAALNDAVAVSSIQSNGKKASYSNFGIWVDVAAPGGDSSGQILSAAPGEKEPKGSVGTSMAAPMVAGIAGMVLAVEPQLNFNQLRSRLIDTADPFIYDPETAEGYNAHHYYKYIADDGINVPMLGSGRVDLLSALTNEIQGKNITSYLNSRVESGCSTLGKNLNLEREKNSLFLLVLLLVVPMLVLIPKFFR